MGHGMEIPSIVFYFFDLFKFYDVDLFIRVGSAGTYVRDMNLGDVPIVENAYSDATYAEMIRVDVENKMIPGNNEVYIIKFNQFK